MISRLFLILQSVMVLTISSAAAQASRMELLISDKSVLVDVQQCAVSQQNLGLIMANSSVKISEHDVIVWNPVTARLTLKPSMFSNDDVYTKLQDHCFYLSIDGKLITSGPILSSHSARLSKMPTIKVHNSAKGLDLELSTGNNSDAKPIQNKLIDTVLRR